MAESDAVGYTRPVDKYEALPEAERYIGAGRFGLVKKVRRVSDGKVRRPAPPAVTESIWHRLMDASFCCRIEATSFRQCTDSYLRL